jgi:hypothetical protein
VLRNAMQLITCNAHSAGNWLLARGKIDPRACCALTQAAEALQYRPR